jgi:hypothetical protein
MINNIWVLLGFIAIILLAAYWNNRNSVWGGLTLGIAIGFVVAIFIVFRGKGFDWHIIGKIAIVGTLLGFVAELLGMASDYLKSKT